MSAGKVQFYYGEGHGKSTAAMGLAIQAAIEGKEATIIQFLKGKIDVENTFMSRLEPEIKVFNFAKSEVCFDELDEEKRQEEIMNLRNGYNYSKKVIGTEMTDLVVLDEILGLLDILITVLFDLNLHFNIGQDRHSCLSQTTNLIPFNKIMFRSEH